MVRFACTALIDRRGWVLMQERDEHARIAPERWGLPGGHVEPGEEPLATAVRELDEETGLRLDGSSLCLIGDYGVFHAETGSADLITLYAATTHATDTDVVCGEGRRMVFVDPAALAELPLADSARQILLPFLGSEVYRRLRG